MAETIESKCGDASPNQEGRQRLIGCAVLVRQKAVTEHRDVIGRLIRSGQYRRNAMAGGVVKKDGFFHSVMVPATVKGAEIISWRRARRSGDVPTTCAIFIVNNVRLLSSKPKLTQTAVWTQEEESGRFHVSDATRTSPSGPKAEVG